MKGERSICWAAWDWSGSGAAVPIPRSIYLSTSSALMLIPALRHCRISQRWKKGEYKLYSGSWAWCLTPVITILRRLRQGDPSELRL